jgi:hypothetical protein
MLKFVFRILLFGLGLFLTYSFGRDTMLPIWYRMTESRTEGRISGFLAGRHAPSVQREADGVRKGKRRARRPVFKYAAPHLTDSLEAHTSTSATLLFGNYSLHERVTVVFKKEDPTHAYILGIQIIFTALACTLLGLYMIRIGVLGRLD